MSKWISKKHGGNGRGVYHTTKNCSRLKGDPKEATESLIQYHDMRICKWCDSPQKATENSHTQDHGYRKALSNHE